MRLAEIKLMAERPQVEPDRSAARQVASARRMRGRRFAEVARMCSWRSLRVGRQGHVSRPASFTRAVSTKSCRLSDWKPRVDQLGDASRAAGPTAGPPSIPPYHSSPHCASHLSMMLLYRQLLLVCCVVCSFPRGGDGCIIFCKRKVAKA